jgi:hypothetical protein
MTFSRFMELLLAALGGAAGTLLLLYVFRRLWDEWGRDLDAIVSGRDRVEFLPSPIQAIARLRAAERRRNIEVAMEEAGAGFPFRREGSQPLRTAFLEVPPNFERTEVRYVDDNFGEPLAQMVRLAWQFDFDQLLLAERVVDAVSLIRRRARLDDVAPVIKLSAHNGALERQGRFPWKVILETDHPQFYMEELRGIADWLGIGIDVAPGRRLRYLSRCTKGGVFDGLVGGTLAGGGKEYAMTCSHVVSAACPGARFRGNPAVDSNQPDAVLLAEGRQQCFKLPSPAAPCTPATPQMIEQCIVEHILVHKRQRHNTRKKGIVLSRVVGFPIDKIYYRFPHLQVVPLQISILGPFKSVFQRAFSVEGHSGSWVFEERTAGWLGMIVAGDEDRKLSFVAEAQPLVNYFASCMKLQSTDLQPISFK